VATDSDSDDQDSPGKGRKNIRKVLKDKHVADDTKKAAQDEEERLKRIAERQRLVSKMNIKKDFNTDVY
jgi:transcriptional regulator ATRX